MKWDEHLLLWSKAAVRILDIRYKVMWEGQDMLSYRLPANVFLLVTSGSAYVQINENKTLLKRNHLMHAGKGMYVDVLPAKHEFACYLIYYKAVLPSTAPNAAMKQLTEQDRPFGKFYHVIPPEPAMLYNQLRRMYEGWQQSGVLAQIRMKALLFEFVYELFTQLEASNDMGSPTDLVTHALRYIHEHYNKPVTMVQLAELLGCSISYMHRLFKAEVGKSPNDYIIGIRMEQAQQYLLTTKLNLREIAESVGYSDVYYFSRLYKKQYGVSPLQARKFQLEAGIGEVYPLNPSRSSIVPSLPHSYNYDVNDNHFHQKGEVDLISNRNTKASMTALLVLCLSLLMSACQTGGNQAASENQSSNTSNAANQASTNHAAADSDSAPATRLYKHKYGETEIPVHPKRVVTPYHLGHMLALGERPLGAATYVLEYSASEMDTTGIVDLGAPLNLELIAAQEPDLIIIIEAYLEPSGGYEAFSKIAPTVVLEAHQDPVKDIQLVGDLLGKQDEAQQWIKKFEAKIAETKERVHKVINTEETFTILNVRTSKIRMIYRDRNMGGNILYTYWGLKPQEKVLKDVIEGIDDESSYLDIAEEAIPDYAGDHIIFATSGDEEAQESVAELMKSGIWKNLDAVKNNKVYTIDFDQFLFNDPIFSMKQVDILADLLTSGK